MAQDRLTPEMIREEIRYFDALLREAEAERTADAEAAVRILSQVIDRLEQQLTPVSDDARR